MSRADSHLPERRVLLVSGPAVGGIRRHLEALASGLPRRGFSVAVAGPASLALPAGIRRFRLDLADRPRAADLRPLLQLRSAVREWQPEIVHAHGVKAALLTLPLARRGPAPGPRTVVTFHNLWRGGPLTLPLRLLLPRAAAALSVSRAVQVSLACRGIPLPRQAVHPNGVDPGRFTPAPSPRPDRPYTLAFLGRLTEEKGVRVLLAASAARGAWGTLLVAGEGPLRRDIEAEAARPGSPVRYLGPVEEVLPVYPAADAVVIPSLAEGQSIAALEAMACSLPVVASRVGGLPEVVEEGATGVLVPPGDPAALAAALDRLARDPAAAAAMGAAGRRRVEREFTLAAMLDRLAGVYHSVLDSPGAR